MPVKSSVVQANLAKLGTAKTRIYYIEINRCLNDASARFVRHIELCGLIVERLPHKTAFRVVRPVKQVTFSEMRQALAAGLHPKLGSILLFSKSSASAWVMSNRGNRRGVFVRV